MQRPRTRRPLRARRRLLWGLLTVAALVYLLPLYWMLIGSFESVTDTLKTPPDFFPSPPTVENYVRLLLETQAPRWFLNSCVVAGVAALGAMTTSALAGYAFSKDFPGSRILFWIVVLAMAVPNAVTVIPLFIQMQEYGWINSYQAMIAPHIAYPFGVFLVRQFMQTVPGELMDAGRVDGASEFQVFRRIVLPLIMPAVAAVGIFAFVHGWTDYLWQLIAVTDEEMKTLPIGVATVVRGYETTDVGLVLAGASLAFAPMAIIFILFQRYFTEGITSGALRG